MIADRERRETSDGALPAGDGIEESPPGIATEPDGQNDEEQLPSLTGLELLKGAGTAGLVRRTPVACDVEGQVGEKHIDDPPRRNSDSSDRAYPAGLDVRADDPRWRLRYEGGRHDRGRAARTAAETYGAERDFARLQCLSAERPAAGAFTATKGEAGDPHHREHHSRDPQQVNGKSGAEEDEYQECQQNMPIFVPLVQVSSRTRVSRNRLTDDASELS